LAISFFEVFGKKENKAVLADVSSEFIGQTIYSFYWKHSLWMQIRTTPGNEKQEESVWVWARGFGRGCERRFL